MPMQQRPPLIAPVLRVVLLLAPRRPVPMRLIESAREAVVCPTVEPQTQAGTGSPDDGTAHTVLEPPDQPVPRTYAPRYWRIGLVLALLALLGGGVKHGLEVVQDMRTQSARLAVTVAQQQEQLHALTFTLQALRTEFGIVTEELINEGANVAVRSEPADLAAVALSPTETRSLTSLMEHVATHSAQLAAVAKEVAQLRSTVPPRERSSPSRYRTSAITHSQPVAAQEVPPPYVVTLPPALGAAGFTPAQPRRGPAGR